MGRLTNTHCFCFVLFCFDFLSLLLLHIMPVDLLPISIYAPRFDFRIIPESKTTREIRIQKESSFGSWKLSNHHLHHQLHHSSSLFFFSYCLYRALLIKSKGTRQFHHSFHFFYHHNAIRFCFTKFYISLLAHQPRRQRERQRGRWPQHLFQTHKTTFSPEPAVKI